VLVSTPPQTKAETILLSMARAMLASMTRSEASEWADQAIRINAVAPVLDSAEAGACLVSEPQVAALAMFLTSSQGRDLSGLVFDLGLVEHA